ncbi:ABC transporter permease [Marivibrio halodurans]|nr:ABC transporter permease [Marivibrio halodurans]
MSLKRWMTGFMEKNGLLVGLYILGAVTLWIVLMIVLPQLFMLDFSFRYNLPPAEIGGPKDVYTLSNYKYLIYGSAGSAADYNWIDLSVFLQTIIAAVFVTLIDLALCYPIAYYLAHTAKGATGRLLILSLIIPYWVNEILRAFAFRIIFGASGVINNFLVYLGLIDQPIDFIREDVALYTGLSYAYILLMIFPIYNAVESLDRNQVEAARDMGSGWLRIHWRIVIPFAKPGIASGCTMVFMLTAGALAAPQILGGPSSLWFTQLIVQWFNTGGNWPRGSAYAIALLIACVAFVLFMMRVFKIRVGEIGR